MYVLNRLKAESRLKWISGTVLLALFVLTAGFQSSFSASAAGDEVNEGGATVSGTVTVGQQESIPQGTKALLIYDDFDATFAVSEESPDGIADESSVDLATGAFSFSNVADGFYLIVITPPTSSDYAPSDSYFIDVYDGHSVTNLSIPLHKTQVKGNVISSVTEQPVKARVELIDLTNYYVFQTKTINGKFSFGGLEQGGAYEILVFPDQDEPYSDSEPEPIQVDINSVTEVTIVLDAPSVVGTVLGPDQEPLPGVDVVAFRKYDDDLGPSGPLNETDKDFANDFTGVNGGFALGKLRPGTYVLEAYGHQYNEFLPPEPIEIQIPYSGPEIVLQFGELQTGIKVLTGRVVDGDGNPVDDARINAHKGNLYFSTETDENGEYRLDLTGGEWNIFIEPANKYGPPGGHDEPPMCDNGEPCDPPPCEDEFCEPPCEDEFCEPPCEDEFCEPPCEDEFCEPPCEGEFCEPLVKVSSVNPLAKTSSANLLVKVSSVNRLIAS